MALRKLELRFDEEICELLRKGERASAFWPVVLAEGISRASRKAVGDKSPTGRIRVEIRREMTKREDRMLFRFTDSAGEVCVGVLELMFITPPMTRATSIVARQVVAQAKPHLAFSAPVLGGILPTTRGVRLMVHDRAVNALPVFEHLLGDLPHQSAEERAPHRPKQASGDKDDFVSEPTQALPPPVRDGWGRRNKVYGPDSGVDRDRVYGPRQNRVNPNRVYR